MRARHSDAFDRVLALLAMQMNFLHEYEDDPTKQAQILIRDIADNRVLTVELESKDAVREHGDELPEMPEFAELADL